MSPDNAERNPMRPIYFDILIAAIVVIAALRGKHRGFILTLCGFLAIFVAFIGASIVSGLLAQPVAALLQPMVERTMLSILESRVTAHHPIVFTEVSAIAVLGIFDDVPFFGGIIENFQTALESGAVELAGSAAVAVAEYAAVQFARILLFVLSFIAVLIVWWVMSHALDLAFHLPGLNFLNRTGGLALGFCQGIALCFILCWLLKDSYITPEMVDGSLLLPYFYGENPLVNISILNS